MKLAEKQKIKSFAIFCFLTLCCKMFALSENKIAKNGKWFEVGVLQEKPKFHNIQHNMHSNKCGAFRFFFFKRALFEVSL